MLQSSKGFVKILQMFSEDENGNVTVSLSNKYAKDNRPVLFPNGEPLPTDSKVGEYEYPSTEYRGGLDGAKGVRMLEQTFALNRYAKAHNYEYSIENIDIDLTLHDIQVRYTTMYLDYGDLLKSANIIQLKYIWTLLPKK